MGKIIGKTEIPTRVVNLGSGEAEKLVFARETLWKRMDDFMGREAVTIPVYLVNPRQMDLLYPKERLNFLSPEQVRSRIRERRRKGNDSSLLQELEEIPYEKYLEVVAVGLYVSDINPSVQKNLWSLASATPEGALMPGRAILLCPERILSWADRQGIDPQLVLDKAYYHELGHALMDSGPTPYTELWARIVEESLANWLAYRRFKGREARWVQRLIQDQPAEYQGYLAVNDPRGVSLLDLLNFYESEEWYHWRLYEIYEDLSHLYERLLRLLRHHPHVLRNPPVLLVPQQNPSFEAGLLVVSLWKKAKIRGAFARSEEEAVWLSFAEFILEQAFS